MNEAKVKALKLQIQAAAEVSARQFFEVDRDETGCGRCGFCEPCQTSLNNLAVLFKRAMERELSFLLLAELDRKDGPPAPDGKQHSKHIWASVTEHQQRKSSN